jgi:hypothetical protein
MFYVVGLLMLMLWSLGLFFPFTVIGFIGILLLTAFLNIMVNKIRRLNIQKIKLYKESVFNNFSGNSTKRSSLTYTMLSYKIPVKFTNKKEIFNQ